MAGKKRGLTKIYQIVSNDRVVRTRLSMADAEKWLDEYDASDLMGEVSFSIKEVWTSANKEAIDKMVKK